MLQVMGCVRGYIFFYVPVLVKLRVAVLTFNLILVDYVFMFHWLVVYVKII